jgi:hypothetical protein
VDAALATIVVLVVRPAEASRDAVLAAGVVAFLAIKLRLSTLRQVLRPTGRARVAAMALC